MTRTTTAAKRASSKPERLRLLAIRSVVNMACLLLWLNLSMTSYPMVHASGAEQVQQEQEQEAEAAKRNLQEPTSRYKKKRLGLKHPPGTALRPLHPLPEKKLETLKKKLLKNQLKNQKQQQQANAVGNNAIGLTPDDAEIIGGRDTTFADHPYFVDLVVCGGTLIHNDIVLTAASCSPTDFPLDIAYVGSDGGTLTVVEKGTQHPDYVFIDDPFELNYDFLVLKLDQDVTTSDIGARVLPLEDDDSALQPGDLLSVVGLGYTDDDGPPSSILQELQMPFVPNEICRFALGEPLTDQQMCAGGIGTGTCVGDGGAPLFRNNALYGVTSWGIGCADPPFPDVFARVSNVHEWLQEMICCLSDTPPSTCETIDPSQCPNTLTLAPTVPATLPPTAAPLDCPNPNEKLFKLDLVTDIYGEEIGWELIDTCAGETIESRDFGTYPAQVTTRDVQQICLPDTSLYEFTIRDSFQDGIFSPGYYSIFYDGSLLRMGGEDFDDYDEFQTTTFGSASNCPPTPAPTPAPPITCDAGLVPFRLELLTDDFPLEISWDLTNDCTDEIVAMNNGGAYQAATRYTEQACVDPNQRHTFKIRDSAGDGICCDYGEGEYSIFLDGVLLKTGGEYGDLEATRFGPPCGPTSAPTGVPVPDCPSGTTLFQLILLTDFYPEEITWAVENECNGRIEKVGGDYEDEVTQFVEDICLQDEQQYTFTIYDFAGDGICCGFGEGQYSLRWDGETVKTGGVYEFGESTTFGSSSCPPPSPRPTPKPTPSPTPSPTKRPTRRPTSKPTPRPTSRPSIRPPSPGPTQSPSVVPSTLILFKELEVP